MTTQKSNPVNNMINRYTSAGKMHPVVKAMINHNDYLEATGRDIPLKYLPKKEKTEAIKKQFGLSHGKGKRKRRK